MGIPLLCEIGLDLRSPHCRGIARKPFRLHTNAGLGGSWHSGIPFDDGTYPCDESLRE